MWLGSDYLGRDVLSRLIYGVRITLFLALVITFLSFFAGVGLGFLAAAFGGRVDMWMSRLNDAMLSFPGADAGADRDQLAGLVLCGAGVHHRRSST